MVEHILHWYMDTFFTIHSPSTIAGYSFLFAASIIVRLILGMMLPIYAALVWVFCLERGISYLFRRLEPRSTAVQK